MSARKYPPAPAGLADGGMQVWRAVVRCGPLRADHLRLLEDACREVDLIDSMVAELADAPKVVKGSQGQPAAHPMIGELRQHRAVLSGLFRALELPAVDASGAQEAAEAREAAISLARKRWARQGA